MAAWGALSAMVLAAIILVAYEPQREWADHSEGSPIESINQPTLMAPDHSAPSMVRIFRRPTTWGAAAPSDS